MKSNAKLAGGGLIVVLLLLGAIIWWLFSGFPDKGDFSEVRETQFPETPRVEVLNDEAAGERYWIYGLGLPTIVDGRAYLHGVEGRRLGMLGTGIWHLNLLMIPERDEILSVETYFTRGTRGERREFVVVYDDATLLPKHEIPIPAKRINANPAERAVALSPDNRFLLVTNYTPAQSISVVDLEKQQFVEELATPGCMLPHSAGESSYYLVCSNGSFMHVRLDEEGSPTAVGSSPILFDAIEDAVSPSPSKLGDTWYFVTHTGNVQPIMMSDQTIKAEEKWPLFTKSELSDGWTIAGLVNTATDEAANELYVLVRTGELDENQAPGTAVWVYDVSEKERVRTIEMKDLTISIDLTSGENTKLVTADAHIPLSALESLRVFLTYGEDGFQDLAQSRSNVYDAKTGEHLVRGPVNQGGLYTTVKAW